jgi:hypothetical protein
MSGINERRSNKSHFNETDERRTEKEYATNQQCESRMNVDITNLHLDKLTIATGMT